MINERKKGRKREGTLDEVCSRHQKERVAGAVVEAKRSWHDAQIPELISPARKRRPTIGFKEDVHEGARRDVAPKAEKGSRKAKEEEDVDMVVWTDMADEGLWLQFEHHWKAEVVVEAPETDQRRGRSGVRRCNHRQLEDVVEADERCVEGQQREKPRRRRLTGRTEGHEVIKSTYTPFNLNDIVKEKKEGKQGIALPQEEDKDEKKDTRRKRKKKHKTEGQEKKKKVTKKKKKKKKRMPTSSSSSSPCIFTIQSRDSDADNDKKDVIIHKIALKKSHTIDSSSLRLSQTQHDSSEGASPAPSSALMSQTWPMVQLRRMLMSPHTRDLSSEFQLESPLLCEVRGEFKRFKGIP